MLVPDQGRLLLRVVRRLPAGVIANSHVCASGQTSHNP